MDVCTIALVASLGEPCLKYTRKYFHGLEKGTLKDLFSQYCGILDEILTKSRTIFHWQSALWRAELCEVLIAKGEDRVPVDLPYTTMGCMILEDQDIDPRFVSAVENFASLQRRVRQGDMNLLDSCHYTIQHKK